MKLTVCALLGLLSAGALTAAEIVNTSFNWPESVTINYTNVNDTFSATNDNLFLEKTGGDAATTFGGVAGNNAYLRGLGAELTFNPTNNNGINYFTFNGQKYTSQDSPLGLIIEIWKDGSFLREVTAADILTGQDYHADDTTTGAAGLPISNFPKTHTIRVLEDGDVAIVMRNNNQDTDPLKGIVIYDLRIEDNLIQSTPTVTCNQSPNYLIAGSVDEAIISVEVTVDNAGNPYAVKSMNLGLTNASLLENAKIYYTGVSNLFNTDNLVASVSAPTSSATLTFGTPTLLDRSGTHYFWVACDIKNTASSGSKVDVSCTGVMVNNGGGDQTETPAITDPNGYALVTDRSVTVFDGAGSKLTIPNNPAFNKLENEGLTVECWIKTIDDKGNIVTNYDEEDLDGAGEADTVGGFAFMVKNSLLYARVITDNNSDKGDGYLQGGIDSGDAVNDGAWHHVAMVIDATLGKLYVFVDGVKKNTWTNAGLANAAISNHDLMIGHVAASADQSMGNLEGSIADVRIWNVSRTEAEIQANMHSYLSPVPASLVGYWKLTSNTTDAIVGGNPTPTDITWTGTVLPVIDAPAIINDPTNDLFGATTMVETGSAQTTTASGLEVGDTNSNIGTGEYVLFSTVGTSDQNTTANAPANLERTEKTWYLAPMIDGVTLDLTFKLADINPSWTLLDEASKYKLLYRSPESSNFVDLNLTPVLNTSAATIAFDAVALSDGFYALGSSDSLTPVVGLNVEITDDVLSWTVDQELGVSHYVVQQLIKGRWTNVTTVQAGIGQYAVSINPDLATRLLVVDTDGFTQTFLPTIGGVATTQYPLTEGWNLLSMPLANADLSKLLAVTEGQPMIWNGEQYEVANVLAPGQGFFVYTTQDTVVTITGEATSQALELESGWNLAGVTENTEIPANVEAVYVQDESYQNVLDQGILIEGVGYWIYVK